MHCKCSQVVATNSDIISVKDEQTYSCWFWRGRWWKADTGGSDAVFRFRVNSGWRKNKA